MPHARSIALLALAAVALAAHGCDGVECGEGTVEKDGDCVLEGTPVDTCNCGTGAHFDEAAQVCLPDYVPAVCNPETTVERIIDGEVTLCLGDCAGGCPSACPLPVADHVTLCGELIDVETGERIAVADGGSGTHCEDIPAGERTGPCLLEVAISNAIEWPMTQTVAEAVVDDCGFYVAANVPAPSFGRLLVAVDDAEGSAEETWVPTATVVAISSGERITAQRTFTIRHSTDVAWTTAAGHPFGGLTFSEKGAFGMRFLRADTPVYDVKLTRAPEGVIEDSDFYFSDVDRNTWSSIDPDQPASGVNGVGLLVDTPLTEHRGSGGLPECIWPEVYRQSFPGLMLFEEAVAISPGGGPC